MTASHTSSKLTSFKHHLLGSASFGVMALAASFAVTGSASAQEITGGTAATATVLSGGAAVTSGATGGQFGAIDTNGGANNPASITLTQSETISVTDSADGDVETSTVAGDFIIGAGVTGTIVFGQTATDGDGAAAELDVDGALDGNGAGGTGGDLTLSARAGTTGNSSFDVNGNIALSDVTLTAGTAGAAATGMSVGATLGGIGSSIAVNSFAVTGGATGGNNFSGGSADVFVFSDDGANIVTVGDGGVAVTGGDAGAGTGSGGQARLVFQDSTTIDGLVTVTGGDEGTSTGNGGLANLVFINDAETVNLNGGLRIATGTGIPAANTSQAGSAEVLFEANVQAMAVTVGGAGIVLAEDSDTTATATLFLEGAFAQTLTGAITATMDTFGEIAVNNTGVGANGNVTFASDIGSSSARVGTITLTDAEIVDFDGDLFVGTITTAAATVEAQFDGDVDATGIDASPGTTLLDFNGDVTIGSGNLVVGDGDATFAGNVGGTGSIVIDAGDDITFDGMSLQTISASITSAGPNTGLVTINNISSDGIVFEEAVGTLGGELGAVDIAANVQATFNGSVMTGQFMVLGDGTNLTFNSSDAVQVTVDGAGAGALTLEDGTINLGSNIGSGDTVFEVAAGAAPNFSSTAGPGGIVINLAANYTEGTDATAITLINDDADLSAAIPIFSATDTALTDYEVVWDAPDSDILITATATSSAQAAATLGVSTGDADALRQAVNSINALGDTETLDTFTTILNAGGTEATTAARQVGPQGETLSGGAQTAFDMTRQQQGITGNRLAGLRSDEPGFMVSSYAATETGMSGNDLDGAYTPPAPRYSNLVWFQGFGGISDADGDTLTEGYDASFGGAMIGIDGALTENVTIGAFGSYSVSTVDGDGTGNAKLDANTYQIGVYGSYTGARFYLDAFASYASSDNDVSRTAFAETITASYDANQFAFGLAGGMPIEVAPRVFITPNASLTWNNYNADSYTETGSAGFSARVNPDSVNQLTGTLGARIHAVYENGGTSFIPELRVGIIGELIDDDAVSTATFVGGGSAFNVTGTDTDDIGAVVGVGLTLDNAKWSASLNYDGDIRSDFMSHTGRAEVRLKF